MSDCESGDINLQDRYGSTALHRAVVSANKEEIAKLIKAGADLNIQWRTGNTALHSAAHMGNTDILLTGRG